MESCCKYEQNPLLFVMLLLDQLAVDKVHHSVRTGGILEYLIAIFAVTFNNETVTFAYSFASLLIPYSFRNLIFCGFLPPFGLLITFVLKRLISRPRPDLVVPRFKVLLFDFRGKEKNHSMPSGDSMQASTFWVLLWHFGIVSGGLAAVLVGITLLARVYYMCHYPSDTLMGATIGILNFYIVKTLLGVP